MATMYSLFFGLLLTAVCGTVGVGNGFVIKEQGLRSKDGFGSGHGVRGVLWSKAQGLRSKEKGLRVKDGVRERIIGIATAELGVREATGRNDGARVEEYLRYTGLGSGHEWCAAFVSWCYGQAGLPQPRNPWSPALFPQARRYGSDRRAILSADLFAIYSPSAKRINHVGIVQRQEGSYIRTIEGNSNNRVESRRRHLSTIYALSDWIG